MKIILASASPRRCQLLSLIAPDFAVLASQVDEGVDGSLPPKKQCGQLALRKARAVAALHPNDIIIGADTIVAISGLVLGKPENDEDARRMLRMLSGKTHKVYTGVAILAPGVKDLFCSVTDVTFYPLAPQMIDDYVATGEPADKAGAYGIQEKGALLVKRIDGDFYNVMGLPVARLCKRLRVKGLYPFTKG